MLGVNDTRRLVVGALGRLRMGPIVAPVVLAMITAACVAGSPAAPTRRHSSARPVSTPRVFPALQQGPVVQTVPWLDAVESTPSAFELAARLPQCDASHHGGVQLDRLPAIALRQPVVDMTT
jgi:hypothetical protein